MAIVMTAGYFTQKRANNGGWADVFWTFGTGAAAVGCALAPLADFPSPTWRHILVAALAAIWSLRLGIYIARRVAQGEEDARYAELRAAAGAKFPQAMFGLMIVQAPATALLCISVIVAAHAPGGFPGWRDIAAAAILAIAIAGETVADAQLARFKAQNKGRHGQINDSGLWAWSRHPNYFFEWFGWLAYPVLASSFGPASIWFWASFAAPILMYLLLTRVSGVPPLERSMLASRGDAFRAYQARTSMFFLLPPKRTAK
jgi:steroid 5-alpha reductase family enzyme